MNSAHHNLTSGTHSIPQRKSSIHPLGPGSSKATTDHYHHGGVSAGKTYFSNTNVMTGIAQHAGGIHQEQISSSNHQTRPKN